MEQELAIPFIPDILDKVASELKARHQAGFLYFDVVDFLSIRDKYGKEKSEQILQRSQLVTAELRRELAEQAAVQQQLDRQRARNEAAVAALEEYT